MQCIVINPKEDVVAVALEDYKGISESCQEILAKVESIRG